jgi:hypothetical protein
MKPQVYNFPLSIWKKDGGGDTSDSAAETLLQRMEASRQADVSVNEKSNCEESSRNNDKFTLL